MIFTENDKEYFLEATQLISPEEIQQGLFLVMAGIDDIPPHIALINEGLYYSVSAKKVEAGVPVANFLKAISRKNVPTLFITIKSPLKGRYRGAGFKVAECFNSYPPLGNGEHSCLWPVRDFFAEVFSDKYKKASLVFELLAMAQQDDILLGCKSLFAPSLRSPNWGNHSGLVLPKYTHEQIREKINSITKVNQ